ncbi:hypothetical protein M8997_013875 [Phyllobacterium sp. 21LDTY02-6]|uniref:hypothetical protein n=1 Tax=unclassified Phyllobacterium TaxID=2638441 RepID=UPI002021AB04|nr:MULTISPECIES: hypothetical protein [unclassified Phyllobacterium]MCO4318279.1 hypothetical protein [Phyllobacterium sp. 21LDTY02-6]MCX8280274.1 hypothetical protein [Phyllobacterium sp. 0TCS1.6C]MCX8294165.1 hypothetical protein [Phyllobacterium sp. 0TCS1.6A]
MALDIRRQEERIRGQAGSITGRADAAKVEEAQSKAFDALLARSERVVKQARDPFVGTIGRLRKPKLANPGIFDLSRSQEILAYLVNDLLPDLDIDEEIAAITASMLNEEIEIRRELQDRLSQAQSQ